MGVTVYYSGRLKSMDELPQLIYVVEDIASSMDWSYEIKDDPWDTPIDVRLEETDEGPTVVGNAGLKGIIVHPHSSCDPLWLLFNKEGQLRTPLSMVADILPDSSGLHHAHTKTQFAGVDLHMRLVKLLKYLGDSFCKEFEIRDDCGYAETGDSDQAKKVFGVIDQAMQALEGAIESMDTMPESKEDMDELIKRIEGHMKVSGIEGSVQVFRMDEEE